MIGEAGQPCQIAVILHGARLIEAVLRSQIRLDRSRQFLFAPKRAPWRQVHHEERDREHGEQHWEQNQYPTKCVSHHCWILILFPVWLAVLTITFFMVNLAPGSPF